MIGAIYQNDYRILNEKGLDKCQVLLKLVLMPKNPLLEYDGEEGRASSAPTSPEHERQNVGVELYPKNPLLEYDGEEGRASSAPPTHQSILKSLL